MERSPNNKSSDSFAVTTTLKSKTLSKDEAHCLRAIKDRVLGKKHQVSLVLIGDKRSRTLNRLYRTKNKPANILSFSLSSELGEIFINVPLARREAHKKRTTPWRQIVYLFIHGVLHLKGMRHGATMENEEKALMRRFID